MRLEKFLTHHALTQNPFAAEEARHDAVFERLLQGPEAHPDFAKILGKIEDPAVAVVFGRRGSGKTAMRLQLERRVAEHNQRQPEQRVMLVAHDDWGPALDRFVQRRTERLGFKKAGKLAPQEMLSAWRLEDHQDGILGVAVTQLNDALLGQGGATPMPADLNKRLKKLPRGARLDWAMLTALYDQSRRESLPTRWANLRKKLRLGWALSVVWSRVWAMLLLALALASVVGRLLWPNYAVGLTVLAGMLVGGAVVFLSVALWETLTLRSAARRWLAQAATLERSEAQLRPMLRELKHRGWPARSVEPSRYEWTRRLLAVLNALDYVGLIVVVDRADEPAIVAGRAQVMKPLIWPLLDNQFLQSRGVGVKLLLPMEVRDELSRERGEVLQRARLDKQCVIDPLEWTGATLYDLCTARLRACLDGTTQDQPQLTSLFEPSVTREMLTEVLDQMRQPRDAFKLLYQAMLDHCRMVSDEEASFLISRTLLETVRRDQVNRREGGA